jgi:tetratricopeptide (TPR) repeat protein
VVFFFVSLDLRAEEREIHSQVSTLILQRNFSEAEIKAKEFLRLHPNDAEGLCALACVYRNKSLKSAVSIDTSAMGIKDGESGTYEIKDKTDFEKVLKEDQSYDRSEYKKAEDLYSRIITIDPKYLNAYFNLLNDYVTLNEFGNYFKVIDLFISNLKQYDDTPYQLNDLAGKLLESENLDQAFRLYSIILQHFPGYFQARSDLGALYIRKGKISKAKTILQEVYGKAPKDVINLNNYYFTCVLTEDFENAYKLLHESIKLENDKSYKLYELALLATVLKKPSKTILDEYMGVRSSEVEDVKKDFWYQTASELSKIETYDKESKLDFLEHMLDSLNKAQYSVSVILVSNIIENIEPTNFSLIVHASVFDKYMFFDKTIEYLNKIKERRKKDPSIMTEYVLNWNFGRIHYIDERYEEAKNYFVKNNEVDKNDASINYYLAKCYLFLGEKEKAIKLFKYNSQLNKKEQMEYINYSIRELKQF